MIQKDKLLYYGTIMKIKTVLLTVLCATSYVKGSEKFEREPVRVVRADSSEKQRTISKGWCERFFKTICCCFRKSVQTDDDDIVSPEQFQQMRQSTQVNPITPPPLPPSALPKEDDPGDAKNRDDLDI